MIFTRERGVLQAFGVILVALGGLLLADQAFNLDLWRLSWPLVILLPGVLFFVGMLAGGRSAGGLAIPGSVMTMVGLLFLYQQTFNHFQSWAYAWALIPTSVGLGIIINGWWSQLPHKLVEGQHLVLIGLIMFAVGGVFFELVLNISGWASGLAGSLFLPVCFMVLGAYLLLRGRLAKT